MQKRQRTQVNTVLALAGGNSRNEISKLTKDRKALHTANVNELRSMANFGVMVIDTVKGHENLISCYVSSGEPTLAGDVCQKSSRMRRNDGNAVAHHA